MINFIRERGPKGVVYFISLFVSKIKSNKRISLSLSHSVQGLVGVQVNMIPGVTAPSINYETTDIPLDLIAHFVKILGLGGTFYAVHLSVP